MLKFVFAAMVACFVFSSTGYACSTNTPCEVGDRNYYVSLPDGTPANAPAVVYIHGWGGSGIGALRNTGMVNGFNKRGFAVITPDGIPREGRTGRSWRFHSNSSGQRDEIAYLQAVRKDAIDRFNLDPERVVLSGFSIGGSMVAYTACNAPQSFAAYAPIGGNFWRPHPTDCAGPVRMLHTHGWTDGTVPLEGRVVNGLPSTDPRAFTQGDIFHAMEIWRATNNCVHLKADRFEMSDGFWRRMWDRCAPGSSLELALFPGGHSVPRGWADLVVDWFETL